MSHTNASSNLPLETKPLIALSKLPLTQNDSNEDQPMQPPLKTYNFARSASAANVSKRLANILEPKEGLKSSSSGILVKTNNISVFHSPAQVSSPQNQSVRQRIGKVKPVTPGHATTQEDDEMMKNIDFSKLAKSSLMPKEFSDRRGSQESNLDLKNHLELTHPKSNPLEESRQERAKQINLAYKIQHPMRGGRSNLNASNSSAHRAYSHSPSNNQNHATQNFSSPMNKVLGSTASYTPSSRIAASTFSSTMEKNATPNPNHKGQSFSEIAQIEKGMLFLRMTKNSTNNSLKGSLPSTKNEIFSMERADNSGVNNSSQPIQTTAWEVSQTQRRKSEYLENKIDKLLANKSTESQNFSEISSFFDSFVANIQDQGILEGSKLKSTLRKIKLAYEIYLQNYTTSQNKKIAEAQEYQAKLERDLQKARSTLMDMRVEIENLRKENEKLVSQNKMCRANLSPSSALTNTSKPVSTEDTPTTKQQIESLKSMIAEQQSTIQLMKQKEGKLVKLVLACKKRGLDIEHIYNEEIKGCQDSPSRDNEEISPVGKGNNLIPSQNQPTPPIVQQKQPENSQNSPLIVGGGTQMDCVSVTDSELYEMEQYEIANQELANYKAKATAIDPDLKNKLKLDFTQLGIAKNKGPREFIIQK